MTTTSSTNVAFRAILISLRDVHDPMTVHEHRCFLAATGLEQIDLIHASETNLGEELLSADLLLFGGSGSYSVLSPNRWIDRFLEFLAEVPRRGVPAWASCFAFQGLALALGGEVVRDDARQQLGSCPVELTPAGAADPLFKNLPTHFHAQFGHHDHVTLVPEGLQVLARGNGGACQAFRVEGAPFWGAQFHPELDKRATLDRWNHYRKLYEGDEGDEIDRKLREAPDTPNVRSILVNLVRLAKDI